MTDQPQDYAPPSPEMLERAREFWSEYGHTDLCTDYEQRSGLQLHHHPAGECRCRATGVDALARLLDDVRAADLRTTSDHTEDAVSALHGWDPDRPRLSESERLSSEVAEELQHAEAEHAPMHGPHEGYAVILEELDELWDEVKAHEQNKERMRKEALQVAAMALRFIKDVCDRG